ncbi:hypothetical protein C0585_01550 [Candidatus Woesearchaeota archaeon]|nr:MAG: hypothetical protein C0585_01550 [Candidatus Woesearchaeota archaeon]
MIYDILLFLVIIAWSIQKILDKKLIKKVSAANFNDWVLISQFLMLLPFFFLLEIPPIKIVLILFFLSILSFFSAKFFNIGIKNDEASRVTPFNQFSALFAVILAIIFLGENINSINFIGVLIMVFGGYLITAEKKPESLKYFIKHNKALLIVLAGAFISAITTTINKTILFSISAFSLLFFRRMFASVWAFYKVEKPQIKNWPLFLTSRVLSTIGLLTFLYVLSNQDVYLTVPILAVQPLLVLILGHKFLDEKKFFKQRLIAIILLIIGYILLKL